MKNNVQAKPADVRFGIADIQTDVGPIHAPNRHQIPATDVSTLVDLLQVQIL